MVIRGRLSQQLHWWMHVLKRGPVPSSFFYPARPTMPLICSDASGEDGWGACAMGFHVVGCWPSEWRQSNGPGVPGMLFKELVPVVVMTMLLAPWVDKHTVFASALDNAGAAFVLNSLSCNCPWSMELLKTFVDSLVFHRVGIIADHAYRQFNTHADAMSHAVPSPLWLPLLQQRSVVKHRRMQIDFVVHDMQTGEMFAAAMSFPRLLTQGVSAA